MMKFEDLEKGYRSLWSKMKIRPERRAIADTIARRLRSDKRRYEIAAAGIGCPWWFIAIIHNLESGGNFGAHLHNGDPLSARTKHHPRGRPGTGSPPFSWEESAADALTVAPHDMRKVQDWTAPRALYELEKYNGWGYFGKINSPYLWSFSNLYIKGKYVADGRYDKNAVSRQCGAAVILRSMIDQGYVEIPQMEDKSMSDLTKIISSFSLIAPAIAQGIGGPLAGIIVKALADEFESENDPGEVAKKIEATSVPETLDRLARAEDAIQRISPVDPPAKAPEPQINGQAGEQPATRPLGILTGYKTHIGILLIGLGYIGGTMLPDVITSDVSASIIGLGMTIGGVGLVDKLERWAPWLLPAKKPE